MDGERLHDSSTSDLVSGIDELVAFYSRAFTLRSGDRIFTGTPPGVRGVPRAQRLLGDGDAVTVGIEGIGELTNTCRTRGR